LTDDQSRFLAGSRQHAARGARVRRAAVLALALLLIISVAAAGLAARADRTANQQRDTAVSAQLADRSEALDATDPVDAAQLAAAAWRIAPTPEAQTSLLDVLAQPTRQVITAAGFISGVAFSPDGKRFAAAGYGFVQVWDTATGREIGRPLNIGDGNASVAFRRDRPEPAMERHHPQQDRRADRRWQRPVHLQPGWHPPRHRAPAPWRHAAGSRHPPANPLLPWRR
jgi:hypothetical protein